VKAGPEIDLAELARRLHELPVVDVRRPAEFDGTGGAPCDPRQGHIPGAVNVPVEEILALDEAELRTRMALAPGAEVVVYCHSGSRSHQAAQALRGAGYDARNYVGSWHEWSRTDLPAES
jgi:thiosulfate/3-mercaptopyruvate sulfurtransferase